jgi:hypothetical protein
MLHPNVVLTRAPRGSRVKKASKLRVFRGASCEKASNLRGSTRSCRNSGPMLGTS